MIQFSCPSCGRGMAAPESAAGVAGRCPSCGMVVTVPLPVWTLKPEPVAVEPFLELEAVSDDAPTLEAADEPPPFVDPINSNSFSASYRKATSQSKLVPIAIKVIGVIGSAFLIAKLLPWTMLLVSLVLCAAGLSFLVIPSVRLAAQQRLPALVEHPKAKLVVGRVAAYSVLVFLCSVWVIRENWRIQAHDEHVARMIHDAESSLSFGRLDDANEVTKRLEVDREVSDPAQVKNLRTKIDAALKARSVKRANERVIQIANAAQEHLLARRFGEVEKALGEAFDQKLATDLEPAKRLANSLVDAKTAKATEAFDKQAFDESERTMREVFATQGATELRGAEQLASKILDVKVSSAKKLLAENNLDKARLIAAEAQTLPGVIDTRSLKELFTQIANLDVAARVTTARGHIDAERFDDAERILNAALSIKNATELADANALLRKLASERERVANARVAKMVAQARYLSPEEAGKLLNAALKTPNATELDDAKQLLAEVNQQIQVRAERKRQEEAKLAAAAVARQEAAERKRKDEADAESRRKAEEELNVDGLVLLRKTLKGKRGQFDGEITGSVVNRRNNKLTYAQITFNLYDASGAQVGSAIANINGLEPGGQWKFKATTFGTDFSTYKFSELVGF